MGLVSPKLRASAKGQPCALAIPVASEALDEIERIKFVQEGIHHG